MQDQYWRHGSPTHTGKFTDLYQDALRRKERQEKIYAACISPDCTFKPDTTVSKYYYQRLEMRDPAYQHKTIAVAPSAPNESQPRFYHHMRNNSEGARIDEKERLHRSLKKSATLSNDLFDPDTGV